jgi:hypothetical protein
MFDWVPRAYPCRAEALCQMMSSSRQARDPYQRSESPGSPPPRSSISTKRHPRASLPTIGSTMICVGSVGRTQQSAGVTDRNMDASGFSSDVITGRCSRQSGSPSSRSQVTRRSASLRRGSSQLVPLAACTLARSSSVVIAIHHAVFW